MLIKGGKIMKSYKNTAMAGLVFGLLIQSCVAIKKQSTPGPETDQTAVYVSPNGDNLADGKTPETALKDLEGARDLIRRKGLNKNMKSELHVYLAPGRYELNQTVKFGSEDSGSNGYQVIYRNQDDVKPVICGGRKIENWTKVPGKKYYEADASEANGFASYFKQLYVNGIRAQQAISNKPYRAISAPKSGDIQKGDVRSTISKHPTRHWWDDPETEAKFDGIEFSKEDMKKSYSNVKDLSVHALLVFKMLQIPLEEIMETDSSFIFRLPNPGYEWWTTWQDASGAMGISSLMPLKNWMSRVNGASIRLKRKCITIRTLGKI